MEWRHASLDSAIPIFYRNSVWNFFSVILNWVPSRNEFLGVCGLPPLNKYFILEIQKGLSLRPIPHPTSLNAFLSYVHFDLNSCILKKNINFFINFKISLRSCVLRCAAKDRLRSVWYFPRSGRRNQFLQNFMSIGCGFRCTHAEVKVRVSRRKELSLKAQQQALGHFHVIQFGLQ